uniref:Peptidase S1 domain-containing protein n=1 Tax=Glossina morsitans morsitans TaxID=37546 RepID=A0A1B0G3P7_GLOMM
MLLCYAYRVDGDDNIDDDDDDNNDDDDDDDGFVLVISTTTTITKLDPTKLEQPTGYAKYVVWLGWDINGTAGARGIGVILSKNIILTNYAINLSNKVTYIGDKKISASGFVIYGLSEFVQRPPKEQLIEWKRAISYTTSIWPQSSGLQIALIKLNKNMKLNSKQAAVMPLPSDDHKKVGKKCVVVGWGHTSGGHIVQTRAIIVRKDKCNKHLYQSSAEDSDKIICIDVPHAAIKTHCEHFTSGAPLICEGRLTGIVSWQWICDGRVPRPCASVYKLRNWIKARIEGLGNLSKWEKDTMFSKYVVWHGLDALGIKTVLGMGVILDKNTVLTSYTLNLTNAAAYYQDVSMPVYGFVVYGIPHHVKEIPISKDMDWNEMTNFGYKLHPKPFQPQIALIKLNDPMKLDSHTAAAISLPIADIKEDPVSCVVVGFGLEHDEDIVETQAVIVKPDECRRKIPDLYEEAICIDMPAKGEATHCDQFFPGAPLICDGQLIGINGVVATKAESSANLSAVKATEMEQFSKYSKHVIWFSWTRYDTGRIIGIGILIKDNVVLTNYADNLNTNLLQFSFAMAKLRGFAVYGLPRFVKDVPEHSLVNWAKAINYGKNLPPKSFETQIALIKLSRRLNLNVRELAVAPLPDKEQNIKDLQKSDCVVVAWGSLLYEDLVETKAVVLSMDKCKRMIPELYTNVICIDVPDSAHKTTTHCNHFSNGSPLICNGVLTAVVSRQHPCNGSKPRICASVYKFRNWITTGIGLLGAHIPQLEEFTSYTKHMVWWGWRTTDKKYITYSVGVILNEKVILTSYAVNLSKVMTVIDNEAKELQGFTVFGIPNLLREIPSGNSVYWKEAVCYKFEENPKPFEPQIALIKLSSEIKLNDKTAVAVELPTEEYIVSEKANCVVVGFGKNYSDKIVQIKAIIIRKDVCRSQIPNIYDEAICIDLPVDPDEDINHCNLYGDGAPLICNGILTCIVSWQKPCIHQVPRPCASVNYFRSWITLRAEELKSSSLNQIHSKIMCVLSLLLSIGIARFFAVL